jgi:D-alanine-D-alanine ligase
VKRRIAVLMGGLSAEREVSLVTGRAVLDALLARGHDAFAIDVGADLCERLRREAPDVCFNALHGRWGEDGTVQGILEILRIPYTHSGVLASALGMHKPTARRLFVEAGLPVADGKVVSREAMMAGDPMPRPYVVKPINEGSSVGVRLVFQGDNFDPAADLEGLGPEVLVERYIPGREIHVAVMGDRALGAVEIRPKGRFYDYEAKYTEGRADHLMPAPLPEDDYQEALRLALAAHRALGCRGVSRTDLRYDDTGTRPRFYVLEVNTQPGMTPLSLVPEIAAYHGISFGELVEWMIEDAGCDR